MDIEAIILKKLARKNAVRLADIVSATGFSRSYIHRFFKKLQERGRILLVGRANQARYILAQSKDVVAAKRRVFRVHKMLKNANLSEDAVLDDLKQISGIFLGLPKNIERIVDYAFTEMLNNAIEHSRSKSIEVFMRREAGGIRFDVIDLGIGIFQNIMRKRKLKNELEAIQDLMKGKQTTAPRQHSGEGIFFTSKIADMLTLQSSMKKLIFHNVLGDIFIRDIRRIKGTRVTFIVSERSKRNLAEIFKKYSGEFFEFSKTKVAVKLYKMDTEYISRSQARRVLSGLGKFKEIILDFKGVNSVGQAFADDVFRVWKMRHPSIRIKYKNAGANALFMIKRALAG